VRVSSRVRDPSAAIGELADRLTVQRPLFVLTGAGCSTASGIPDYRDPDGAWRRGRPIHYRELLRSEGARRRYWARSFVGWPRVAAARPNAAHQALAAMERAGVLHQLVTQNVDGLHQAAGHRRVLDLHGRLAWVDCLDCPLRLDRHEVQRRMADANPGLAARAAEVGPDGDAGIDPALVAGFRVPDCPCCGGLLKPAVVFFGENVRPPRVRRALARLRESRLLLAVGTSLAVFSGFRFCREAKTLGIPVVLVNRGRTRADDLADLKVDAEAGDALGRLARGVGVPRDGPGARRRDPEP
jgi:NAD-dependent SIR2 family protein deacetylase